MTEETPFEASLSVATYPPYDAAHGTPHAMVQRVLVLRLGGNGARLEQTDYGHPGRFNPWSPRGIDPPLQPRTDALLRLCDGISALLTG
jgi:hypothetical protein